MSNEIEKYDDMVRKYGLSHNIATNKSKGIWQNQIPSDHLFQTYEQFVCKRIANQSFGIKWPELEDWGPKECRKFYNERLMEGHKLPPKHQLNLTDSAIATTLNGATQKQETFLLTDGITVMLSRTIATECYMHLIWCRLLLETKQEQLSSN